MSRNAWQPVVLGPAAIAIHDDCDVSWETSEVDLGQQIGICNADAAAKAKS